MKQLLIGLMLSTVVACSAPVTITTPQGKTAYTADQIVLRVNELENTAIAANAAGSLPVATTRTVVEWCVNADKTLAATPQGWMASLAISWGSVKASVGVAANPAVAAAMSAVDAVFTSLGGQ